MATNLSVNGSKRTVHAAIDTPLLHVLRNDLELNGAKFGCGLGQCGACTVLVDGQAMRSCVIPVGAIGARQITTIEGLGTIDEPHPVQRAFIDAQAVQCGYCTAGMVMAAVSLLQEVPDPTDADVRYGLEGNLCRCTGYQNIVASVLRAAELVGTEGSGEPQGGAPVGQEGRGA